MKLVVRKAKDVYRNKIESKVMGWKGIKSMASVNAAVDVNRSRVSIEGVNDQLNDFLLFIFFKFFFYRFERHDFSTGLLELKESLSPDRNIVIEEEVVNRLPKGINVNKYAGPNGTDGRTWKFCADQLSGVLRHLFPASIDQHLVPTP